MPPIIITCQPGVDQSTVGPALEQLYGNLYATVRNFVQEGVLDGCHTYQVSRGNELLTMFIFRVRGKCVEVLNEVIAVSNEELDTFAHHIFLHYGADVVSWRAIEAKPYAGACPCQQYDYLEDALLRLPATVSAYHDSLSKNTRRAVKRQERDALRELPGYSFEVVDAGRIEEEQVRAIIALNHARMQGKRKLSGLDEQATRRIASLVMEDGFISVVRVNGELCAGAVACRAGGNYFLLVLAHQPAYDSHGLGFLCCYNTICACIERGAPELHFLWGRYEYKRSFLASWRRLDRVLLYRSRWAVLRHAGLAWQAWRQAQQRRVMLRLRERAQQPTPLFTLAYSAWVRMRNWHQQWRQSTSTH